MTLEQLTDELREVDFRYRDCEVYACPEDGDRVEIVGRVRYVSGKVLLSAESAHAHCLSEADEDELRSEVRDLKGEIEELTHQLAIERGSPCSKEELCVLDEGHGGDCVQRDGTRIHRQRRSGAQEASAKDEGEGMANPERIRSEVDYSRCNFCKGPYQGGKRIRKYGGAAIPGCSDEDACLRYASEHPERFDKERKRLRSGVAPSCATPGCVRTPGHLDECLMDGKEKTSA